MDTSPQPPAGPRGAGPGATWGSAPYPVVVADPSGGVVELNAAATVLFPGAITGAWLQLKDLPRARRMPAHAREALGTRTPTPEIPGPGKPV
ncbi:hypothetical protein [Streptomyces sp. NPDC005046]